jgi:hypothetical protein
MAACPEQNREFIMEKSSQHRMGHIYACKFISVESDFSCWNVDSKRPCCQLLFQKGILLYLLHFSDSFIDNSLLFTDDKQNILNRHFWLY